MNQRSCDGQSRGREEGRAERLKRTEDRRLADGGHEEDE